MTIDIMVFHTILEIFTPLFIFHHIFFGPFSIVDDIFDSPLFSLCPLVSRILFLLFKGDHTSFFSDLLYCLFEYRNTEHDLMV